MTEDGLGVTDEDMMQKAMRRKAVKNLDTSGMKSSSASFILFSDSKISSNLSSVGVSLGSHPEHISVSANVLRHLEHEHLTVISKTSTGLETPIVEEDEVDVISDGQLLSAIVGSISEVDLEQSGLDSFYDLKASRRNSKSSADKKNFCRSGVASKSKIVSK
jgi:hypothetical protein